MTKNENENSLKCDEYTEKRREIYDNRLTYLECYDSIQIH